MRATAVDSPRSGAVAWLAVAVVLFACALRVAGFARCGIDHFDEGVYALSADGLARGLGFAGLFEGQERFSPPLYFGLAAALEAALGTAADRALIACSLAAGTASVALVWVAGRRWFGAGAGLAAAALLAGSEFHVGLSRAALTDATFALLHLGAVLLLAEAFERKSLRLAVLGGALTGLAWNTKYHGWFALVSTGLALLPVLWTERTGGLRAIGARLVPWFAAAAVAGACYLPWALYVESLPGGYAELAAYQKTMLRPGWIENLWRHVEQQRFSDGAWSCAAIPAALALALAARGGAARALKLAAAMAAALAFGIAGQAVAVPILALAGACTLLPRLRDVRAATLIAWLVLWTVMTPLYQPYARLYLPLAIGLMLAAGVGLDWIAARVAAERGMRGGWVVAVVAALAVFAVASRLDRPGDAWRPARGADEAARSLAREIEPGARVIVLGEPSVAFYLHELGFRSRERVEAKTLAAALAGATERTWVVAGIYPRRTGAEERVLAEVGPRLAHVATVPLEVRDLRLLDDFHPAAAARFRGAPSHEYDLRLYRFDP